MSKFNQPKMSSPGKPGRFYKAKKWIGIVVLILVAVTLAQKYLFKQPRPASESNLPQFIKANFVDPKIVASISRFRSGAGHSYPGWPETCRSMKHYVTARDTEKPVKSLSNEGGKDNGLRSQRPDQAYALDVISPVDGRLTKSGTGEGDDQVNISVDGYRGYTVRFEHVHLDPGISSYFSHVKAGQKIATVWNNQNYDISVWYHYYRGDQLFSYFDVLPDNLFAVWQAQGIKSRSDLIISKEYRDAHPLTCLNDVPGTPSFADANGNRTENWNDKNNFVWFAGYGEQINSAREIELKSINSFTECAKHYPVQQTYPETCRTDDGRTFTKQ